MRTWIILPQWPNLHSFVFQICMSIWTHPVAMLALVIGYVSCQAKVAVSCHCAKEFMWSCWEMGVQNSLYKNVLIYKGVFLIAVSCPPDFPCITGLCCALLSLIFAYGPIVEIGIDKICFKTIQLKDCTALMVNFNRTP